MEVQLPTIEQLREMANIFGLHRTDTELEFLRARMSRLIEFCHQIDHLEQPCLPIRYAREKGFRPSPEENLLNAWYWKCSIKGAPRGRLNEKRIAVKDNICVAGIPMMNGFSGMEGYVPDSDATVVTRTLDAGGEIVGKSVCHHLCISTPDTGPVLNPHDTTRSTGGSSSGSAALVAAGECEMAIGCDQGGSIRVPSSFCGIYGLKPTYGLVPYTGIMPLELTLDTVGPMATTVSDIALLLEVLAGEDGLDPRQKDIRVEPYTEYLTGDAQGVRIGILEEGFGWPDVSESDVDEIVAGAAHIFSELGSEVKKVPVPMHRNGQAIHFLIASAGMGATTMHGNGVGTNWKGHYSLSMLEAFGRARTNHANDISDRVWLMVLFGQYLQDRYYGYYYAKAQNLSRVLAKAYDDALQSVDVLIMPTTPMKAPLIPTDNATREERFDQEILGVENACCFNVTGHPAISIPCGRSGGMPIGMMLVGKRWDEGAILRAAYAFEQTKIYTSSPIDQRRTA